MFPIMGDSYDKDVQIRMEEDSDFSEQEFRNERLEQTIWMCIVLGTFICIVGYWLLPFFIQIANTVQKKKDKNGKWASLWVILCIGEILFCLTMGVGAVCFWRGVWYFWDLYILSDDLLKSGWISMLSGIFMLILLSTLKSILAPPAVFLLDGGDGLFYLQLPDYSKSNIVIFCKILKKLYSRNSSPTPTENTLEFTEVNLEEKTP